MAPRAHLAAIAFALIAFGCSDDPLVPDGDEAAPLQTDRLHYQATVSNGRPTVEVTVTYTNRSGEVRYVGLCTPQSLALTAARELEGGWVSAYASACPRIYIPPVEVPPGASRTQSLVIQANREGFFATPAGPVPMAGVYRLSAHVYRKNPSDGSFELLPEEAGVSNPFRISEP